MNQVPHDLQDKLLEVFATTSVSVFNEIFHQIDFVCIIKPVCDQIQGLSASTRFEGVDRVRSSLPDSANNICTIETFAYYIAEASIRLFLPQVYFQENKWGSLV